MPVEINELLFDQYLMLSFFGVVILGMLGLAGWIVWLALFRPEPDVDGPEVIRVIKEECRRKRRICEQMRN